MCPRHLEHSVLYFVHICHVQCIVTFANVIGSGFVKNSPYDFIVIYGYC